MSRNNSSVSFLSASESQDDDATIPDERDWKLEINKIKSRTGDFNITHYVHILNDYDKRVFNNIIKKIPEERRVYI